MLRKMPSRQISRLRRNELRHREDPLSVKLLLRYELEDGKADVDRKQHNALPPFQFSF